MENGRPEWANHTHQLQPGEEIVVNRDDAAERGEGVAFDEKRESLPTTLGEGSSGSVDARPEAERRREQGTGEHIVSAEGRDGQMGDTAIEKEEDMETTEWREGDHLVIERDPGHGEEVSFADYQTWRAVWADYALVIGPSRGYQKCVRARRASLEVQLSRPSL